MDKKEIEELIVFKDNVDLLLTKYGKKNIYELEKSIIEQQKYSIYFQDFIKKNELNNYEDLQEIIDKFKYIKIDELDGFCIKYKDDMKKILEWDSAIKYGKLIFTDNIDKKD